MLQCSNSVCSNSFRFNFKILSGLPQDEKGKGFSSKYFNLTDILDDSEADFCSHKCAVLTFVNLIKSSICTRICDFKQENDVIFIPNLSTNLDKIAIVEINQDNIQFLDIEAQEK